ncbi:Uncharacterised protein [Candidatus Anstonella stagnisolia]|nr:Uncharacterised protein [Candidatus Anstonella stagnisolia]
MARHILLALLLFSLSALAFSDIIEPGTHRVAQYVRFSNLNDYPAYAFYLAVGTVQDAGNPAVQMQLASNEYYLLDRGYKFNSMYLMLKGKGNASALAALPYEFFTSSSISSRYITYKVLYNAQQNNLTLVGQETTDKNFAGIPIGDTSSLDIPFLALAVFLAAGSAYLILKLKQEKKKIKK